MMDLGPGPPFDPNASVLFIGSSTIARFPLSSAFPGKPCVNLGRGNENTLALRARLPGALPSSPPGGIVLYVGSADLRFEPALPAKEIRERVEGVVSDLNAQFPGVEIAVIEVLPARHQSEEERIALRALNDELIGVAHERNLWFVPTNRPPLVDSDGSLLESMSVDRHHLNEAGYRVLAQWIIDDTGAPGRHLR